VVSAVHLAVCRRRLRRGFTLLELSVTVVIAGIVATMGVVAVGALRDTTQARQAESLLDTVAMSQYRFALDYGRYTPLPEDLSLADRTLTVVATPSMSMFHVSIAVGSQGTLAMAVSDGADGCFARRVGQLGNGAETTAVDLGTGALCDARAALPAGESPVPAVTAAW
jgi:prepilin-type N-terminal cleavage/methylation domain-containing protein